MGETKGSILRFSLWYALGKIRLARHKLSERDREQAADDVMRELRRHGGWKDLDDPVESAQPGPRWENGKPPA